MLLPCWPPVLCLSAMHVVPEFLGLLLQLLGHACDAWTMTFACACGCAHQGLWCLSPCSAPSLSVLLPGTAWNETYSPFADLAGHSWIPCRSQRSGACFLMHEYCTSMFVAPISQGLSTNSSTCCKLDHHQPARNPTENVLWHLADCCDHFASKPAAVCGLRGGGTLEG